MPVTNYIWDVVSDNLLMETDENDEVIATYQHEPTLHGELISMTRDGKTYYYEYDGEGNTVGVTDENQNVVEEATYTAFGEVVEKTSSIVNSFGYKGALGYYTNPETGDCSAPARAYQPIIGRWLSNDPKLFVDGPNMYLFVQNDPINRIDPEGTLTLRNVNASRQSIMQLSGSLVGCLGIAQRDREEGDIEARRICYPRALLAV